MPKFRKKPVVIEAVQLNGNQIDIIAWAHQNMPPEGNSIVTEAPGGALAIRTMEGEMLAIPNDWIIRGVKGEFYPCKPDIFAATYEPAE